MSVCSLHCTILLYASVFLALIYLVWIRVSALYYSSLSLCSMILSSITCHLSTAYGSCACSMQLYSSILYSVNCTLFDSLLCVYWTLWICHLSTVYCHPYSMVWTLWFFTLWFELFDFLLYGLNPSIFYSMILSSANCQLSPVNYQLSTVNCHLSAAILDLPSSNSTIAANFEGGVRGWG